MGPQLPEQMWALWLVFQRFFGIRRPKKCEYLYGAFVGIYGIQNIHMFELICAEAFSDGTHAQNRQLPSNAVVHQTLLAQNLGEITTCFSGIF